MGCRRTGDDMGGTGLGGGRAGKWVSWRKRQAGGKNVFRAAAVRFGGLIKVEKQNAVFCVQVLLLLISQSSPFHVNVVPLCSLSLPPTCPFPFLSHFPIFVSPKST